VQSTLILSRKDGSIIKSSGLLSQSSPEDAGTQSEEGFGTGNGYPSGEREPTQSAEDIAKLTWSLVQASQALVEGVEGKEGEEAKLMRVRGRRKEIVIVPGKIATACETTQALTSTLLDTKYLLVVVHETPPA